MLLSGVLSSLCLVFKHGKRDDVIGLAPKVLSQLTGSPHATSTNTNLRKLHVKVVQWLGVTLLPPRVAKWRYQRGGRSLEEALTMDSSSPAAQQVGVASCSWTHSRLSCMEVRVQKPMGLFSSVLLGVGGRGGGGGGGDW